MTPLVRLVAGVVFVVSLFLVYIGFFAHPRIDANRARYIHGAVQVERFAKAVERYREHCGKYPNARDGLNALIVDPGVEGWHGPYLENGVTLDPWGRPYIYLRSTDSAPEIISYGADGKPGGELFDADISSRNPWHSVPDSPREVRTRLLLIGVWVAAWVCMIGSVLVLRRTSRVAARPLTEP